MRRLPLRWILLLLVSILLILIGISFLFRAIVNHLFATQGEPGDQLGKAEEMLLVDNFPEPEVPCYNLGNDAYNKGDYNSAIHYYNEALGKNGDEEKDCAIRINYALSLANSIDYENLDEGEEIQEALYILYSARNILLENGCAADGEEVGHNADAQQLKEDIDKMIEKLESQQPSGEDGQDQQQEPQEDNQESQSNQTSRESRQQESLQNTKEKAMEERQETQNDVERHRQQNGQSQSGEGEGEGEGEGDGEGEGNGGQYNPW